MYKRQLQGTERDTGLDLERLQYLTEYWEDVRKRYDSFEGGLTCNNADIYRYEIPGGQYTNLKPQVESLGLGSRFMEVKENYRKVNEMLGDIVKVTPSSKICLLYTSFSRRMSPASRASWTNSWVTPATPRPMRARVTSSCRELSSISGVSVMPLWRKYCSKNTRLLALRSSRMRGKAAISWRV